MPDPIPPDVVAFIRQHITSLEQMEMLCLLALDGDQQWTAKELAGRLGSSEASISHRMQQLAGAGVIGSTDEGNARQYRFSPSPEREQVARAVVAAYGSHRISVTNLIYGISDRPGSPLSSFADSFRLRKDDPQ